jgi:hypothetical protein
VNVSAELKELEIYSEYLILYMARRPIPSETFATVMKLIGDIEIERVEDDIEILTKQLLLQYITHPETVQKGKLLEFLVCELTRHAEYTGIAIKVAKTMFMDDDIGTRRVMEVVKRYPLAIASWLPAEAARNCYPWLPMFVEWVEAWWESHMEIVKLFMFPN